MERKEEKKMFYKVFFFSRKEIFGKEKRLEEVLASAFFTGEFLERVFRGEGGWKHWMFLAYYFFCLLKRFIVYLGRSSFLSTLDPHIPCILNRSKFWPDPLFKFERLFIFFEENLSYFEMLRN